ncbi:MAG: dihydrolipoamide acetyltransferase family protein [Verrucomicrobiales bacterium]
MAAYLKMPKLSDTMTEGTLVKWLKNEGDSVAMDEDIAEVETDKATMTMPSFDEGTLHKIYVKEGDTVALGATLALVLAEGEEPPEDADSPPDDGTSTPAEPDAEDEEAGEHEEAPETPAEEKPEKETKGSAPRTSPSPVSSGTRVKASPLARKLAAERGVDIARLQGTGPGGRIVKDDVENAPPGGSGSNLGLLPPPVMTGDQTIPVTGIRRVIAQRLLESKTTIPHFYLNIEIDADPLMALRSQVNEASVANEGPKYTVNDFIMRAAVLAAGAVPAVNASFQGDSVVQYGDVNLSVAVAVEEGLVTPVIRSAQTKSIKELAAEIKDLATRAREKKLSPDEMQGGTLTLSNLGAYGISNFDAIINPPQAIILSIGAISKQAVVDEHDRIVPGLRMWVGMSCDHRVVDGAVGAQYLSELKHFLQNPVLLIS